MLVRKISVGLETETNVDQTSIIVDDERVVRAHRFAKHIHAIKLSIHNVLIGLRPKACFRAVAVN